MAMKAPLLLLLRQRKGAAAALLLFLSVTAVLTPVTRAIYPDDHWNYATELTEATFDAFVQDNVQAGKSVFVRWIASPYVGILRYLYAVFAIVLLTHTSLTVSTNRKQQHQRTVAEADDASRPHNGTPL